MAMPLILATVLLGAPAPEDSIAPVDIVPPSLGPTPPPVPEPTVPEPMVSEPPELALPVAAAPQEPPPSGNGRLAAGFVTLGFGITTLCTALEGAQRKDDPSNPTPRTTGLVIVGLLGVGTGSALVISGARARRSFDAWRGANTDVVVGKNGNGLITGGVLAIAVGSAGLVYASLIAPEPATERIAPALLTIGTVEVAAGIGLLSWGIVRRGRYRAWRASTSVPTLVPLRRGAGLGLVGRF